MRRYYIHFYAREDVPESTMEFTYSNWKEMIEMCKRNNYPYKAYSAIE